MFERFTERARQVVVNAQDEARACGSPAINDAHLLLGLLHETQDDTLGKLVLNTLGLTYEDTKDFVLDHSDSVETPQIGHLPFTTTAKKMLELALREALSLGHNYIGTEHLLLGMVRENSGLSALVFEANEVTAESVRNEVIRCLSKPRASRDMALVGLVQKLTQELAVATGTLEQIRRIVEL